MSDFMRSRIRIAAEVRMGYMAQPDFGPAHIKEIEKKTAEAIDAEGWMHTGDKGVARLWADQHGNLKTSEIMWYLVIEKG